MKDRLKKLLGGGVAVFHMYGLTEMSVWQSMTRLDTAEMVELMPIFVPGNNLLSHTEILSADSDIEIRSEIRKCWILDSGELETSATVRTGDVGRWSDDGKMLCWRGRQDDVVKILGRKVSLEEVGDGLSRELSTPVVCVLEAETNLLHAFIRSESDLTEVSVLAAARRSLPSHQLPARVHFLAEFPLTDHGKTDLRHLRDLAGRAGAGGPLQGRAGAAGPLQGRAGDGGPLQGGRLSEREMGEKCGELWESLLGAAPVGEENFLTAGGDSFSALALVNSLGWDT